MKKYNIMSDFEYLANDAQRKEYIRVHKLGQSWNSSVRAANRVPEPSTWQDELGIEVIHG